MTKNTYEIPVKFTFDPTHKGAPYSLNGTNWMNHGDLCEILDKACKGYDLSKDANTAFNEDSDIPQTHTSVKSSKATLTSMKLGADFEEVKRNYFSMVASTNWDYVVVLNDTVIIYNMNATEFAEMIDRFGRWNADRKVIRFLADSSKTLKWLDERC